MNLANHYAIPTIYPLRQYAEAGGLMSYGANLPEAFRQCGIYVGKLLKGANPPTYLCCSRQFMNLLSTSRPRRLGLAVSPTLQALADEVIE